MRTFLIVSTLLIFSSTTQASSFDHPLLKSFPKAQLFSSKHLYHADLPIPADSLVYRDSNHSDEGYFSEKLLTVAGQSTLYVHDFSKQYTSEHLYKEFIESLNDGKFEVLYQCQGEACGDLTGWRLFLSKHIAGNELSQKYVLSRRQSLDSKQWFVQFYVIDLDGEPRSVLRFIEAESIPQLDIAFSEGGNQVPGLADFKALPSIVDPVYFDFDKAELSIESKLRVSEIVKAIQESHTREILITGYADRQGPSWYNKLLATRRAEALRDALKAHSDLSNLEISTYGYGEVDINYPRNADHLQRKVNVFIK